MICMIYIMSNDEVKETILPQKVILLKSDFESGFDGKIPSYEEELWIKPLSYEQYSALKAKDKKDYEDKRKKYRDKALEEFPLRLNNPKFNYDNLHDAICDTVLIRGFINEISSRFDKKDDKHYAQIVSAYKHRKNLSRKSKEDVHMFFEHMDYITCTFVGIRLTSLLRSTNEYAEFVYDYVDEGY